MLGNITCWIIAIALVFSRLGAFQDMTTKLLLAMGFIFLGILAKAVDVYYEIHKKN